MALSNETHIKLTIGIFLTMMCSVVVGTWVASKEFSNIKYQVHSNENDISDLCKENRAIESEMKGVQIQQAEISTKLVNIESGILEIKSILKDR